MPDQSKLNLSARFPAAVGIAAVLLLLGGTGFWAATTGIAGAVVASGTVQIDSDRQIVQHPDGGVVREIHARDGDRVQTGDLLVSFDDTFLQSELEVIERQLFELFARQSRLRAERDEETDLAITPPEMFAYLDPSWIAEQTRGQLSLFQSRHASLKNAVKSFGEQTVQIDQQITGLLAQLSAVEGELALLDAQLDTQTKLLSKGLIVEPLVNATRREKTQLMGQIGRLTAGIGEARAQISVTDIEVLKLFDRRREEAISRLRDLRFSEIELLEKRQSLREQHARMDVRAPADGVIFDSRVRSERSVMRAAEPLMYIVPTDLPVEIAARVDPTQIDQIYASQAATLRFTAFDQRMTPEVFGTVKRISPDTVVDDATGRTWYEAILVPDPGQPNLAFQNILPGMPVEVFLKTEDRTPLTYLVRPLSDYFRRAFRES